MLPDVGYSFICTALHFGCFDHDFESGRSTSPYPERKEEVLSNYHFEIFMFLQQLCPTGKMHMLLFSYSLHLDANGATNLFFLLVRPTSLIFLQNSIELKKFSENCHRQPFYYLKKPQAQARATGTDGRWSIGHWHKPQAAPILFWGQSGRSVDATPPPRPHARRAQLWAAVTHGRGAERWSQPRVPA